MATSSDRADLRLAAGLLVLAIVGQLTLLTLRRTASVVSGDEGTYLAMTESLALDFDLVFGPEDLERLEAASERGRKGVILQEYGEVTAYSKPVAYAVLAAPWYRLAGPSGLVAFNIVAFALSLLLAWGALVRWGAKNPAATVATFAGAGVLMSYTVWTMSDSLQASLALAGLALGLGGVRARAEPGADSESAGGRGSDTGVPSGRFARIEHFWTTLLERPWAPYLGVALLAIVASMRLPNLALAGAPVLAWLFRGGLSRKNLLRPILLAAVVVLVTGTGFLLNQALGGATVPYKAVRATFNPQSGYPVGERAEQAREQFSPEVALATQSAGVVPDFDAEVSLYSTAYFWIGRHTGLLWYFPLAGLLLVAGLPGLWRRDAVTWALLLTAGALAVFYLVWMPRNYFGGATFLGNRYFLTGYVALLLLPRKGVSRRVLSIAWTLALIAFVSALASITRTRDREPSSQNHAYAGLFRLLPYESTAEAIDGRSDVYWTEEFFRFVDPYAIVDPTGFSLPAGDPEAELLHVSQRDKAIVRFVARADTEVGEIVYRGQGVEKSFHLEPNENGVWGLVEIELLPTQKRHKYWFHPTERLHTRTHHFRLRTLDAPAGSDATASRQRSAELHYIGSMRLVPKFFRGIIMTGELPKSGRAGKRTLVPLRVRNTGYRFWSSEEMIPTRIGYRLFALPRKEGDKPVAGRLFDFEGRVPRAHEVDVELDIRWPKQPGRYELEVDLNLGKAVWYGAWNQKPLASTTVRVRPAAGESESELPDATAEG